jgi:hypothetical protein
VIEGVDAVHFCRGIFCWVIDTTPSARTFVHRCRFGSNDGLKVSFAE